MNLAGFFARGPRGFGSIAGCGLLRATAGPGMRQGPLGANETWGRSGGLATFQRGAGDSQLDGRVLLRVHTRHCLHP